MSQIIIFPNDNGGVVFCYPSINCDLSIEEIARKDVPAGKPYLLVPGDQVPTDHTFFSAFEADFSNPHGYGIGADAWHAEKAAEDAEAQAEAERKRIAEFKEWAAKIEAQKAQEQAA